MWEDLLHVPEEGTGCPIGEHNARGHSVARQPTQSTVRPTCANVVSAVHNDIELIQWRDCAVVLEDCDEYYISIEEVTKNIDLLAKNFA